MTRGDRRPEDRRSAWRDLAMSVAALALCAALAAVLIRPPLRGTNDWIVLGLIGAFVVPNLYHAWQAWRRLRA
ncbi:hypothetical protein [Jannaschia sp. LMIT008]|uniref:hypothetical protein n=1 Tax=Jannaschia maritima TaxID=3032585 RepID=UPI002811D2EE|nr:hypothetical protein [Jannaschia sp. LMIT008]